MTTFLHLYDTKRDRYVRKAMNYTKSEARALQRAKIALTRQGRTVEVIMSKDFIK